MTWSDLALNRLSKGLPAVAFAGLAFTALAAPASAAVVISQVYGGGGNSGATLKHDFIEIFNNGTAPVDVSGWAVQYASANGSAWQTTPIPANTSLPAGRYLLIREAQGAGGTVDVVFDVSGTIAMSGTSGKVALTSSSAALSGTAPTGGTVIDIVSYGASTPTEGSPTAALTNTTAALRNASGCTDTNSNSADFTVAAASPRSNSTAALNCGGGNPPPVATAARIFVVQGSGNTSPLVGALVPQRGAS